MSDATQQTTSNRYALVSSLYGPGTIACWYLTILSVLVSWTLHPKKRKSGSIDVDLIAVLTLPVVAAGHLLSQILTLMRKHDTSAPSDADLSRHAQTIAAIEAPFSVIETFMALSVILFLVVVWTLCLRRAIFVATVGLLCLATECYIHFSNFKVLGLRYNQSVSRRDDESSFGRSFVADFAGLIIAILVILAVCAATASLIVVYMLSRWRARQENGRIETQRSAMSAIEENRPIVQFDSTMRRKGIKETSRRYAEEQARGGMISGWISLVFLPATMFLTLMPSAFNAVSFGTAVTWTSLEIFVAHFYPHSANSFSDLDQAVTTAAGASILAFSIYGVAKAHYEGEKSQAEQARLAREREIELDRLAWR